MLKFIRENYLFGLFIIYAAGFIAWNNYLSRFGFFEYTLLQTRFLSAGTLYILGFSLVLAAIQRLSLEPPAKTFWSIAASIILVIIYIPLFPNIPQHFGGAKPFAVSIIGTPEQINFLNKNFGVPVAKNAEGEAAVQTVAMCNLYQNGDQFIFGTLVDVSAAGHTLTLKNRVLTLRKDQFLGYEPMPPNERKCFEKSVCEKLDLKSHSSKSDSCLADLLGIKSE